MTRFLHTCDLMVSDMWSPSGCRFSPLEGFRLSTKSILSCAPMRRTLISQWCILNKSPIAFFWVGTTSCWCSPPHTLNLSLGIPPPCSQHSPHFFLLSLVCCTSTGSQISSNTPEVFRDLKLTHVVNAATELPCPFKDTTPEGFSFGPIQYLHLDLEDAIAANLITPLRRALPFLKVVAATVGMSMTVCAVEHLLIKIRI